MWNWLFKVRINVLKSGLYRFSNLSYLCTMIYNWIISPVKLQQTPTHFKAKGSLFPDNCLLYSIWWSQNNLQMTNYWFHCLIKPSQRYWTLNTGIGQVSRSVNKMAAAAFSIFYQSLQVWKPAIIKFWWRIYAGFGRFLDPKVLAVGRVRQVAL